MRAVTSVALTAVLTCTTIAGVTAPASAAGDRIVYDYNSHIWIMDGDGANKTDLMSGWTGFAANPSLSPDGTTVIFQMGSTGATSAQEIYATASTPSSQASAVRLTNNSRADLDPAWSPDGSQIAFTRDRPTAGQPQNYDIFTMAADGSGATMIAGDANGETDSDPAWSPNGATIAFRSTRDGFGCFDEGNFYFIGFSQIYTVPSGGGTPVNLLNRATLTAASPDWSPDGTQITFYGDEYTLGPDIGNGVTCASDVGDHVYTMPAGGSSSPSSIHTGIWPSWSPDGTKIVFSDGVFSQTLTATSTTGANATTLGTSGRFADWTLPGIAKIATSTSLTVTSGAKLRATGTVAPNVAGQVVNVVLSKKVGGVFKKVATKAPTLDASSGYVAAFAHPTATTCRIKTTYAGDATHLPSSKSQTTAC